MPLVKIHANLVRHSDGWEVFTAGPADGRYDGGRGRDGYRDNERTAYALSLDGTRWHRIYRETLRWADGSTVDPNLQRTVAFRIKEGVTQINTTNTPVVLPDEEDQVTEDDSYWAKRTRPALERNPNVTDITEY